MYFGAKIAHFFVIQFIFEDYLEKWRNYILKFGFILIGNLAYNYFRLCIRFKKHTIAVILFYGIFIEKFPIYDFIEGTGDCEMVVLIRIRSILTSSFHQLIHILGNFIIGHFGIALRGPNVRVSHHFADTLNRHTCRKR